MIEFITTNSPAKVSGQTLETHLNDFKNYPLLLLVSGGSAFTILSEIDEKILKILGGNLSVSILDERFSLSKTEQKEISNFQKLSESDFATKLKSASGKLLPPFDYATADSLEKAGKEFSDLLHSWRKNNPTGKIIITLGLGADGHTAGLFPNIIWQNLDKPPKDNWVIAYEVPKTTNPFTKRISVTFSFLKTEVDIALVYALGSEKQPFLKKLFAYKNSPNHSDFNLNNFPAGIITKLKSAVIITDQTLS